MHYNSIKTGQSKLGCIYDDLAEKQLERVRIMYFFTENSVFYIAIVFFYAFPFFTDIKCIDNFNPFAPGDFAEKCVLKLVEWFSGHSHAIKS